MKIFFCVIFMFSSGLAWSQSIYSFAGLSWGDQIEIVDSKLYARGFSKFELADIAKCKAVIECSVRVSGPAVPLGYVFFKDGALNRLSLNVSDGDATENALRRKYGPPQPFKLTPGMSPYEKASEYMYLRWSAPNGEAIQLWGGKQLDYFSQSANKIRQKSGESGISNF